MTLRRRCTASLSSQLLAFLATQPYISKGCCNKNATVGQHGFAIIWTTVGQLFVCVRSESCNSKRMCVNSWRTSNSVWTCFVTHSMGAKPPQRLFTLLRKVSAVMPALETQDNITSLIKQFRKVNCLWNNDHDCYKINANNGL
jgi:hypothetical protein